MTQNIYDNPEFFAGYSQLGRSVEGLAGAAEWPSIRALLPPMQGLRVVDLGCGYGWFCRWAAENGASQVLGLDVSERMLDRARQDTVDPKVAYQIADLEQLSLPVRSLDLAYSSLALHYVDNLDGLLQAVSKALLPEGQFVFSIEHPIYMAPSHPDWREDDKGHVIWPLDNYLNEGPRTTDWLAKGVIKQHRTLGTTLNALVRNGFAIRHVEEWGPSAQQIADHPEWARERDRPMFLLISATRTG